MTNGTAFSASTDLAARDYQSFGGGWGPDAGHVIRVQKWESGDGCLREFRNHVLAGILAWVGYPIQHQV
jgi:hypothetical protein